MGRKGRKILHDRREKKKSRRNNSGWKHEQPDYDSVNQNRKRNNAQSVQQIAQEVFGGNVYQHQP